MLIGYDDDSALIVVVPLSGVRVAVTESLNLEVGNVSEWCDH